MPLALGTKIIPIGTPSFVGHRISVMTCTAWHDDMADSLFRADIVDQFDQSRITRCGIFGTGHIKHSIINTALHNCIHVRIDHDGFCFRVTPLQYAMKISTESVSTCIPNFCMRPFKNSRTWKYFSENPSRVIEPSSFRPILPACWSNSFNLLILVSYLLN